MSSRKRPKLERSSNEDIIGSNVNQTDTRDEMWENVPSTLREIIFNPENGQNLSLADLKKLIWSYVDRITQAFAQNNFRPLTFGQIYSYVVKRVNQPSFLVVPYLVVALSLARKHSICAMKRNLFRLEPTALIPNSHKNNMITQILKAYNSSDHERHKFQLDPSENIDPEHNMSTSASSCDSLL